MAKKLSWYDRGLQDGERGDRDPPMNPGHPSYERYMEGHADGERALERERLDGEYYGANRDPEDD